jgi:hypothetical protein
MIFGLTWLYLHDEIRKSTSLREEFHSAVRRLIATVGIFVIPAVIYLLEKKQAVNDAQPYALVWAAGYVVGLLFLLASLVILARDAKHEKKTGSYRFRR